MRTTRSRLVALLTAATLVVAIAAPAAAAPVERTRSTVNCDGSDVTLVMHPGAAAPVQWDISVEDVENAPSFIAKYIEADIYLDGQYAFSYTSSLGQMVGLGEPLSCTFEVHKPGFDAYGSTELVLLAAGAA